MRTAALADAVGRTAPVNAPTLTPQGHGDENPHGCLDLLLAELETRFGPLPAGFADAVRALPKRRLRDFCLEVLAAQSLTDLSVQP